MHLQLEPGEISFWERIYLVALACPKVASTSNACHMADCAVRNRRERLVNIAARPDAGRL